MWIAVCDDDQYENDLVVNLINEYAVQYDYDLHCRSFSSGESLLRCDQIFDMYILDYQLGKMDGMVLAEKLRKEKNVESYIVFLTAYMHFIQEAFKVNTHRFLHKPVNTEELYEALNSLMLPTVYSRHISLKQVTQEDIIYTNDIICIEAQRKTSLVTMKTQTVEYNHLMKDIYDILPKQLFFKVHRSYIINFEYIKNYSIRDRLIVMKDGRTIPVSRDRINDFVQNHEIYVKRFK
ncbi:MAG: response regulator transcription factor [Clostridia bacterium]|nr:response regulator transcription factor [Clostridia bacterium]